MLDKVDVAILTRLNDLAERLGLRRYDSVATRRGADGQRQQFRYGD